MAISTLASLRTAINSAPKISCHKEPISTPFAGIPQILGGAIFDYWEAGGYPSAGVNASTAAGTLYSRSSVGAININTLSGSVYSLCDLQAAAFWIPTENSTALPLPSSSEYTIHVWDRVWANGNLPLNTTARQSWTPPALTRYASGEGLSLWMRIYTTQVINNSNVTLEYINSSGVSRTFTSAHSFATNGQYFQHLAIPMPFQTGDQGIRSLNAVTLGTASASGTYGFIIAKYLGAYRVNTTLQPDSAASNATSIFSGLPQFDGNACLNFGIQIGRFAAGGYYCQGTMPRIAFEAKVIAV